MKSYADKKRTFCEFAVDDLVFLKLQPYIQNSVALRSNQKLAFKYYGSYRVLARVSKVAYRLDLPESSKIHPVIHVSQLKKALGSSVQVQTELPNADPGVQVPFKILQRRLRRKGASTVSQVRVHWSGMAEELATWEDTEALRQHFPADPAWGQAATQGEGIVSDSPDGPREEPGPTRRIIRARRVPARLRD